MGVAMISDRKDRFVQIIRKEIAPLFGRKIGDYVCAWMGNTCFELRLNRPLIGHFK